MEEEIQAVRLLASASSGASPDWLGPVLYGMGGAALASVTAVLNSRSQRKHKFEKDQLEHARQIKALVSQPEIVGDTLFRDGRKAVFELYDHMQELRDRRARNACRRLVHAASAEFMPEDLEALARRVRSAMARILRGQA